MATPGPGIIGDIGATNARFALVNEQGALSTPRVYALNDYTTICGAIDAFLEADRASAPSRGVLAVAAPMTGDQVAMTNHAWTFSIEALRQRYGLRKLQVINDFAANALSIPHLGDADRAQVGGGAPSAGAPTGVIGPGTGLGVSALVLSAGKHLAIQGEGGHVTMPAIDARESAVLAIVRRRFGHASAERVVSGPGLVNVYDALRELEGLPVSPLKPAQITEYGLNEQDACAGEAVQMFCAMLGTIAGDLALTLGARGGIFIAGGIVPKLGAAFGASRFRARFEAKGRFSAYLAAIPTYVITRPLPALVGAAALLADL